MCKSWILLYLLSVVTTSHALNSVYDPCCSFPCEHSSVCLASADYESYTCDCTGVGYSGNNCHDVTWGDTIENLLFPSTEAGAEGLVNLRPMWRLLESLPRVKSGILSAVYMKKSSFVPSTPQYAVDGHHYTTVAHVGDKRLYTSLLPPVPPHCPTPSGTHGRLVLPPVEDVVTKLFQRHDFTPSTLGANLLYASVSQAFAYHFFKPDSIRGPSASRGHQELDLSHLYGTDTDTESLLRTHVDGKMRMQVIDGEDYPPYLSDIPGFTPNPSEYTASYWSQTFALGDSNYGLHPGLFLYQTIWLREHNRICDVMKAENPEWDDERLFQTAKLILIGETLQLTVAGLVSSTYNYNLKFESNPASLKDKVFVFDNRVYVEYKQLYQWQQLIPDTVQVQGKTYTTDEFLLHPELLIAHGTRNFTAAMVGAVAGEITLRNHAPALTASARRVIQEGRDLKLQPYNEYRKRFGLKPVESFEELTGGRDDYSRLLAELYGDVDSVELYVGLMAEKRRSKGLFGVTLYDMFGSFSIKAIYSSPVSSPGLWKPSTFGGEVGFNIVKTASLKKIFCDNIPGECQTVSLRVPGDFEEDNLWYMNN